MVGRRMSEAALQAGLPTRLDVSLVERYVDGAEIADGLVQGLRFDITAGRSSFRIGAERDETADVVVEITVAAARRLNALRLADPAFAEARQLYLDTGEMRVTGDVSRLGGWLDAVHDPIVDETS